VAEVTPAPAAEATSAAPAEVAAEPAAKKEAAKAAKGEPKPARKEKGKGKGKAAEAEEEAGPAEPPVPPRLKERYRKELVPILVERFGYRNLMEVPRITKVAINMGLGSAVAEPKIIENAVAELSIITGQRPVVTRAKKSIATFRIRTGNAIGARVTLRGNRMYEFLDRLLNIALPRIRDFRGLAPDADGRGNYTIGVRDQTIFPEIDLEKVDHVRGMNITLVTTARTDEEAMALLKAMGLPVRES
jgi:large subunit ribosomal protein L5